MKTSFRERLRVLKRLFFIAGIVGAMLCGNAVLGQSLSIKKVGTNYTLQASASPDSAYTLQASENFHLWIDVTNDLTGSLSLPLEYPRVSSRCFLLIPSPPEPPPVRIMAFGDSLIGDCCGWGAGVSGYLKPNAIFINYASPGAGTKFFLDNSVAVQNMLLIKPEYVLFEFGLVDSYNDHLTDEQFEANLKAFINIVRSFNGVPLAVTLQPERRWDATGNFIHWDHPFNLITRRVAAEMNVPLIDFNKIITDLYKQLGPTHSEFMRFTGLPDDTIHLSPLGAVWASQRVLKTLPSAFGPYLTEKIFDPPPNP